MKIESVSRRGFSLLELLAVVSVIGLLASIIITRASMSTQTAAQKACFHNRAQLNSAIEQYYIAYDSLPATLSALQADYFPSGLPTCPVSGNAYTLNGTGDRVDSHIGSTHP